VNTLLEQGGWGLINASYLEAKSTPLCLAVSRGDMHMVELLLEKGARVEIACPSDVGLNPCTPLVTAVRRGYKDVAALLIEKVIADGHLPLPSNWSAYRMSMDRAMVEQALVAAGETGQEGMARMLLPHIPFSTRAWLRILGAAAKNGHEGFLRALFEQAKPERVAALRAVLVKAEPQGTKGGTQPTAVEAYKAKTARECLQAMLGQTTPGVLSYLLQLGVVPDSDELDWISYIKPTSPCWADDACVGLLLDKAAVPTKGGGQLEALAQRVLQHGTPHSSVLHFLCNPAKVPDELLDGLLTLAAGGEMRTERTEHTSRLRTLQLLLDMGRGVEAGLAVRAAAQKARLDCLASLLQRASHLRREHLGKALETTISQGRADDMRLIMSEGITMRDMFESRKVTMCNPRRLEAGGKEELRQLMEHADTLRYYEVIRGILENEGQKAHTGRLGLPRCVRRDDYDMAVYYLAAGDDCKNGLVPESSPLLHPETRLKQPEAWIALIAVRMNQ
jgi:hypothetical protein